MNDQPRWVRRKDARPSELTAAALDLFVEKGFAATRMEDIASRAGVSKGTLYLYFPTKDELFKAVIRDALLPVLAGAEQRLAVHAGSAEMLLRELIRAWWISVGSKPIGGIPKLMVAEARNFPELAAFYYEEVISRGLNLMRAVLERGVVSGEFRQLDLETMPHVAFAPLIMFAIWRHSLGCCGGAQLDGERYVEQAAQFIVAGLRAQGGIEGAYERS